MTSQEPMSEVEEILSTPATPGAQALPNPKTDEDDDSGG